MFSLKRKKNFPSPQLHSTAMGDDDTDDEIDQPTQRKRRNYGPKTRYQPRRGIQVQTQPTQTKRRGKKAKNCCIAQSQPQFGFESDKENYLQQPITGPSKPISSSEEEFTHPKVFTSTEDEEDDVLPSIISQPSVINTNLQVRNDEILPSIINSINDQSTNPVSLTGVPLDSNSQDSNTDFKLIKTQKGKPKLVVQGYQYCQNGENSKQEIRWRCQLYQRSKCPGRIKSKGTMIIEGSFEEHNHWPCHKEAAIAQLKATVKEKANTREGTAQIINAAFKELPRGCEGFIPKISSLKRNIQRERRKNLPAEPEGVSAYVMDEKHKLSIEGELFLLFDSACDQMVDSNASEDDEGGRNEDTRRLIILGTKQNVKYLAEAKTWYADGTFGSCPKIFKQLYIIHADVHGAVVPLLFALCTHKDQHIYQELLCAIKRKCAEEMFNLSVETIVTDFELAMTRAVQNCFHNKVKVHYCYFHFCQSLYRVVQKEGLVKNYFSNEQLRDEYAKICALTMVPPHALIDTFQQLKTTLSPEAKIIARHVDNVYLRGRKTQGCSQRKKPRFEKEAWNSFELIKQGDKKTNNYCESYNSRLIKVIGHKNPGIQPWMDILREEQKFTEVTIAMAMNGRLPPKSKKQAEHLKALKQLANTFEEYNDLLEYLTGCANNLRISNIVKTDQKDDEESDED